MSFWFGKDVDADLYRVVTGRPSYRSLPPLWATLLPPSAAGQGSQFAAAKAISIRLAVHISARASRPIADDNDFGDLSEATAPGAPRSMKHPILTQTANDIKAARKIWLPWRVLWPWMIFSLAVILLCDRFGRLDMSIPLLLSIGIFGFFVYLKWGLRRQPIFWSTIAILAGLHAVLIWYIPWTSDWVPAVATAGIASVDLCLMLWILAAVEVLLGSQSRTGN